MLYLDTSALVKLVVHETESRALLEWLKASADRRLASELARVELSRALGVAKAPESFLADAKALFEGMTLIPLSREVLDVAGSVRPTGLRTLDSIYLASALLLGPETIMVTYDERLASAAHENGLTVSSPK